MGNLSSLKKLHPEATDNLHSPISFKEIELLISNLPKKNILGSNNFMARAMNIEETKNSRLI